MKNKIYYWSPHISKVGTVKSTLNSILSLRKYLSEKVELELFNVFGEWDEFKSILKKKDIKTINLIFKINKYLPILGFYKSRFSYLLIIFFSAYPLFKILKKKKPDILIIHLLTSLPLLLFKMFNFNTKLVLRISGFPKLNLFRTFIWKLCRKKIFAVTCPTEELKKKIIELEIFDSNKIFFLPDPIIDVKEYLELKKKYPTKKYNIRKNFFLSIGRLTKQKNYFFLINEFEKFCRVSDNFDLVIIGDGEHKYKLMKMIKEKKLDNKVHLLGYEENFYYYLQRCTAFILPSLWEELGLIIVQAALSNAFIISSDCPNGTKEFLNNGEGGILFSNNQKNQLYKSLINFDRNKKILKSKILISKKNVRKYTIFNHYLKLSKILNLR